MFMYRTSAAVKQCSSAWWQENWLDINLRLNNRWFSKQVAVNNFQYKLEWKGISICATILLENAIWSYNLQILNKLGKILEYTINVIKYTQVHHKWSTSNKMA